MTTILKRCLQISKNRATCISSRLINTPRHFTVMSAVVDVEQIRVKLLNELKATHVEVIDDSGGCGANITCVVVAEKFDGVPLLQRHRLVHKILNDEIKNIHAFSPKTYTPEQWEKLQPKQ